jgi:hypothetical protein
MGVKASSLGRMQEEEGLDPLRSFSSFFFVLHPSSFILTSLSGEESV